MDVGVNQPGNDVFPGYIVFFFPPVISSPEDNTVFYGDRAFIPCAGERIEDAGVFEYCIRWSNAASCIEYVFLGRFLQLDHDIPDYRCFALTVMD